MVCSLVFFLFTKLHNETQKSNIHLKSGIKSKTVINNHDLQGFRKKVLQNNRGCVGQSLLNFYIKSKSCSWRNGARLIKLNNHNNFANKSVFQVKVEKLCQSCLALITLYNTIFWLNSRFLSFFTGFSILSFDTFMHFVLKFPMYFVFIL